jgi:hypothetical protein
MTPYELLHEAESHGVHLWAEGPALRYRGAQKAVQSLLPAIRRHKPELLRLLSASTPAFAPLDDAQLADLIASTAKINGLDPLDVWRWMDLSTVEDVRGGDPAVITSFRGGVESAVKCDTLTPPAVPHNLPFPGGQHQGDTDAGRVTCGDCGHYQPNRFGAGGIGRCAVQDDPPGGLLYPRIERRCPRYVTANTAGKNANTLQNGLEL